MKDYEIINQEFNRLESDVSYYFFPNLLYNTCIETNLTSLCYVPSFRKQNNHEKLDYELFLQTTLKRILISVNEERYQKPSSLTDLLNENDKTSLNKIINIYCPDLIERIERITELKVFNIFEHDVVLLNDDLERLFDFLRIVDLHDVRIEIIRIVLDTLINKKKSNQMLFVSLKRKKDPFYEYSRLFPEYIDDIKDCLIKNDCQYISFEDFASKIFDHYTFELLMNKVSHYQNWVNKLDSGEHYTKMLFDRWSLDGGSLRFALEEDLKNVYESEALKLFDKVNDYRLCDFNGLSEYLIHVDVTKKRHKDWISSIFSSEKLFNDVGYLQGVDNTSLVTGYLKSIEQLLGNLIIDDSKENRYSPSFILNGKEIIINEETLNDVGMLGNLTKYIKYNHLFIKNKNHKEILVKLLNEYRKYTRNGYLHKDSIHSYQNIVDIRKDSIALTIIIINAYYLNNKNTFLMPCSSTRKRVVFDVICKGDATSMGKPPFLCKYGIKNVGNKNVPYMYYSLEKYRTLFCFNFYYETDKDIVMGKNKIEIENWDDINLYVKDERTSEEKALDSLCNDDPFFEM